MPIKVGKVSKAGKRGKTAARATPRPQTLMHKPHPETKLDVQHSTQLAQTAVAAIFFEIVWVRKVFQDHGWQNRTYHPDDPNNSYDAYVQGSDFALPTPNDLHYWHVPNRGEDERVDKLMNCLESCAKEPIEKGYLQKLQLCFHTVDGDVVSEENLIESYSLTFEYENGVTSSQLSRRIKDAQTEKIDTLILSEGRQRLIDMANKLFECIYKSDRYGRLKQYPLPAQFRLNLLAEYNDSAPDGYQPAYFKPGDAATVALLSLCNSDKEHIVDTGYHGVSVGLLLPGSTRSPARRQERPTKETNLETSSQFNLLPHPLSRKDSAFRPLQHARHVRLSSDAGDEGTQREAVHQLKDMGLTRVLNSTTQDTQHIEQQYSSHAGQPIEARHESSKEMNAPPYTQYILDHLTRRLFERAGSVRGDDLDELQHTEHDGDIAVNCECGCQVDGGGMIYCVECRQLQHAECYGYLDEKPSNHICYSCLADLCPEEKPRLVIVANLCIERLALRFLRDKGIAISFEDLANYLGRSLESTDEVIDALEGTGLVQKYNKTRKSHSPMVKYLGMDENLREQYFRPQRYINNLFALPDEPFTNNELELENVRSKVVTPVAASSTRGDSRDSVPSTIDESGRPVHDVTTQGEPSDQCSAQATPRGTEFLHLHNIARHGLNLNWSGNGTPVTKRVAEFESPVVAVKRVRTSRASPMLFDSSIPK